MHPTEKFIRKALDNAATRSKKSGLAFNLYRRGNPASLSAAVALLADHAARARRCPVFPLLGPLEYRSSARRHDTTASLDRIDPDLGYVWGNVRWISWRANHLRGNLRGWEMEALARDLRNVKPAPEAYAAQPGGTDGDVEAEG